MTSALFEGLPPAPTPPPPDAPGGSQGVYDTATWKPARVKRYVIVAEQEDETLGGYVTLQFAAEMFDVQRERLQVACWRGALPGKKVAGTGGTGQGQWFVHPGDVARYLATTLRGVTNRRKADELSPLRAERERQRLLQSAAAAEARAQAAREKLARLGPSPDATTANKLGLRVTREELYVKNRTRVARGLERQQQALAEAAAQREAWAQEHGGAEEPEDVGDAMALES